MADNGPAKERTDDVTDSVYSTYEAKARFSEVLRQVREGRTITVTYRGDAVAEIRPLARPGSTEARLDWLRARGALVEDDSSRRDLRPVAKRPGALRRFLRGRFE